MQLSEAASDAFRKSIHNFLKHYSFLNDQAKAADLRLFHKVPKHHKMMHMGYESQFEHPGLARTYSNEDYMQHCSRVGLSNRHGVAASRRALTVTEKMALGKSVQLLAKSYGA